MYEQEVVKQTEHIEKMKADGKDEYDIKKQVPVAIRFFEFSNLQMTVGKELSHCILNST